AIDVARLERLTKRHCLPAHAILGQNAKDRVGLQHAEHALARKDRERLALAQMQEAPDSIDIRAGEDDSLDWRRAKTMTGMEDRIGLDLLAEVRRGIDQEPAFAVAAHGKRCLGASQRLRVPGARASACFSVRIPLRESTTGRRPEDHGLHAAIERLS